MMHTIIRFMLLSMGLVFLMATPGPAQPVRRKMAFRRSSRLKNLVDQKKGTQSGCEVTPISHSSKSTFEDPLMDLFSKQKFWDAPGSSSFKRGFNIVNGKQAPAAMFDISYCERNMAYDTARGFNFRVPDYLDMDYHPGCSYEASVEKYATKYEISTRENEKNQEKDKRKTKQQSVLPHVIKFVAAVTVMKAGAAVGGGMAGLAMLGAQGQPDDRTEAQKRTGNGREAGAKVGILSGIAAGRFLAKTRSNNYEGSKTDVVKSAEQLLSKKRGTILKTEAICSRARITIRRPLDFSSDYLNEIQPVFDLLSTVNNVTPLNETIVVEGANKLTKIFQRYGAHYFQTGELGGKITQLFVTDATEDSRANSVDIEEKAKTQFGDSVKSQLSSESSRNGNQNAITGNLKVEQKTKERSISSNLIVEGGAPGSFGPSGGLGSSPMSWGEWAGTVDLAPVPINYKLQPISPQIYDLCQIYADTAEYTKEMCDKELILMLYMGYLQYLMREEVDVKSPRWDIVMKGTFYDVTHASGGAALEQGNIVFQDKHHNLYLPSIDWKTSCFAGYCSPVPAASNFMDMESSTVSWDHRGTIDMNSDSEFELDFMYMCSTNDNFALGYTAPVELDMSRTVFDITFDKTIPKVAQEGPGDNKYKYPELYELTEPGKPGYEYHEIKQKYYKRTIKFTVDNPSDLHHELKKMTLVAVVPECRLETRDVDVRGKTRQMHEELKEAVKGVIGHKCVRSHTVTIRQLDHQGNVIRSLKDSMSDLSELNPFYVRTDTAAIEIVEEYHRVFWNVKKYTRGTRMFRVHSYSHGFGTTGPLPEDKTTKFTLSMPRLNRFTTDVENVLEGVPIVMSYVTDSSGVCPDKWDEFLIEMAAYDDSDSLMWSYSNKEQGGLVQNLCTTPQYQSLVRSPGIKKVTITEKVPYVWTISLESAQRSTLMASSHFSVSAVADEKMSADPDEIPEIRMTDVQDGKSHLYRMRMPRDLVSENVVKSKLQFEECHKFYRVTNADVDWLNSNSQNTNKVGISIDWGLFPSHANTNAQNEFSAADDFLGGFCNAKESNGEEPFIVASVTLIEKGLDTGNMRTRLQRPYERTSGLNPRNRDTGSSYFRDGYSRERNDVFFPSITTSTGSDIYYPHEIQVNVCRNTGLDASGETTGPASYSELCQEYIERHILPGSFDSSYIQDTPIVFEVVTTNGLSFPTELLEASKTTEKHGRCTVARYRVILGGTHMRKNLEELKPLPEHLKCPRGFFLYGDDTTAHQQCLQCPLGSRWTATPITNDHTARCGQPNNSMLSSDGAYLCLPGFWGTYDDIDNASLECMTCQIDSVSISNTPGIGNYAQRCGTRILDEDDDEGEGDEDEDDEDALMNSTQTNDEDDGVVGDDADDEGEGDEDDEDALMNSTQTNDEDDDADDDDDDDDDDDEDDEDDDDDDDQESDSKIMEMSDSQIWTMGDSEIREMMGGR